jgi:hypothetical protein
MPGQTQSGAVSDAYTGEAGDDPLQDSPSTTEGQDAQSQSSDPGGDAAKAGDDSADAGKSTDDAAQGDGDGEQDGAAAAEPTQIEGTPFKDQSALVKGYKEIQKLVANKDREIENLQRQVQAAVDAVQAAFGKKPETDPQVPQLPEGQELWNAFAKDPGGTIQKFVDAKLREVMQGIDPRLKGVEDRVGGYEQRVAVQQFMISHPEIDTEMEKEIADVLKANPDLIERKDLGLEIALNHVLAGRYRAGKRQASTDNAVAGAKSVAGVGGKKASVPAQKKEDQDIFDDVLRVDKEERELFNLGRKS